ncbi:MAG: tubulin-like doman-containing protein [Planctomycetaceae bacterium]
MSTGQSMENVARTTRLGTDTPVGPSPGLNATTLAGYKLESLLGSGGYGEVYRAIGPGGLAKAVKVLFGQRDGEHAEAEMKSLERMRDLRHPFLLNIERIEICNNRLIVVTELADGNLEDRYRQCREEGLAGIPRDELLSYLRDAADALDFMFEQHGMQHLDIKPDNLLLQGNHVKVGDFGLAKDVNLTNVSLVNGFTPLFAPPEIFEGRPGATSDQYSLAIVYQTMLTGTPPFNGRTAAQLTAQHLRSQPDLTSLQPVDRPVIARALAKNVHSRFDSCRQLIDELSRRKTPRSLPVLRSDYEGGASEATRTALVQSLGPVSDAQPEEASQPIPTKPVSVKGKLLRPTVFVGVGGLAGEVLRSLKARLNEAYGPMTPAMSFLQIDTNRNDLRNVRSSTIQEGLKETETVHIPLRSSKDYRAETDLDLSWLSRRWLFNIPRSGEVEGIRPLGRLALFDHRRLVRTRLKEAILQALEPDSVKATAAALKQGIDEEQLDIVVVAATSGGTSSGAVADVAFLIRDILRSRKLSDVSLQGILLHGTGAVRNVTDVQEANTVSCLQELQLLSSPGLGLEKGFSPSKLNTDTCPFDDTYLFHCGDGLNASAFSERTTSVAQYLFTSATTSGGHDFRAWRTVSRSDRDGQRPLRLLGLASLDQQLHDAARQEARVLCSLVLRKWSGSAISRTACVTKALPPQLADTQTLLADLQLTDDTLPQQVVGVLRGKIGQKIEQFSDSVFRGIRTQLADTVPTRRQALNLLADVIASPREDDADAASSSLQRIVLEAQRQIQDASRLAETEIRKHLVGILDAPHRMEGCSAAVAFIINQLKTTATGCENLASEIEQAFNRLCKSPDNDDACAFVTESGEFNHDALRAFCREYCVLVAYQTIYRCFFTHVQTVRKNVVKIDTQLTAMQTKLQSLMSGMSSTLVLSDSIPQPVIDAFDGHLRSSNAFSLGAMLSEEANLTAAVEQLFEEAITFLMNASSSGKDSPAIQGNNKSRFPENAWPVLHGLGGYRRVLGHLPACDSRDEWATRLVETFGDCVAIREASDGRVMVVCEIDGVSIDRVLKRMTARNPHIADVAGRVHTRIDVPW